MLVKMMVFLQVLKDVRVSDGYSSNILRCVKLKERKISGMKSHDNHILMQQLFPIAICGSLPLKLSRNLLDLSCFFRKICSKVLNVEEPRDLEKRIAVTLCELFFLNLFIIFLIIDGYTFLQALVRVKALQDRCVTKEGVVTRVRKHNTNLLNEQGQYKDGVRILNSELKETNRKLEEASC